MKFILICLSAVMATVPAFAGFDSGNAGDAYSAEFLFSGRDVLQRLELLAANRQPLMDTGKLRAAMEKTQVVSEDRVYLDGQERDAVNFPSQKLIKISRMRWKDLRTTGETKARLTLALHEFMWIAGIDDTNFVQSGKIIDKLNVPAYSPAIWLSTPGTAFAGSECTGRLADGSFVTVLVSTKGATRAPDQGEVRIERGGNKFGYRFKAEEISQFFTFDDAVANTATVGLGAYVNREFPISLKYDGPNYVDMDLRVVIETGGNTPAGATSSRNFLRVWKGPGYAAEEQYKLEDPVCAVSSNN